MFHISAYTLCCTSGAVYAQATFSITWSDVSQELSVGKNVDSGLAIE